MVFLVYGADHFLHALFALGHLDFPRSLVLGYKHNCTHIDTPRRPHNTRHDPTTQQQGWRSDLVSPWRLYHTRGPGRTSTVHWCPSRWRGCGWPDTPQVLRRTMVAEQRGSPNITHVNSTFPSPPPPCESARACKCVQQAETQEPIMAQDRRKLRDCQCDDSNTA